ncbi:MAG: 2OG-Fe(II) oxygenase [Alkalimonas sp.]|nr:2OG-Fe(II) oxygenase [Alkalimonas sp.]
MDTAQVTLLPENEGTQPLWLAEFEQHGLVVLPQFLPADLVSSLHQEIQHQARLQPAAIGRAATLQLAHDIRRDKTCWLEGNSIAQQLYMQQLNAILAQFNRHFFLGLTGYECHFAHYQPGDFYRTHLDAFSDQASRRVTSVCYLNDVEQGGELVVYDAQHQPYLVLPPRAGTLILFESSRFPHEVKPTAQHRYSIAGWFRQDPPLF